MTLRTRSEKKLHVVQSQKNHSKTSKSYQLIPVLLYMYGTTYYVGLEVLRYVAAILQSSLRAPEYVPHSSVSPPVISRPAGACMREQQKWRVVCD